MNYPHLTPEQLKQNELIQTLRKEFDDTFGALCWNNPQHTRTKEKFEEAYFELRGLIND